MAYAIIRSGGKQFRVSAGEIVRVPSLADKNEGDAVEFEVLVIGEGGDGGNVQIGNPVLTGAKVTGTVVKNARGPKIIVFKFKRRKSFKKIKGHRQGFTAVKIDAVA